jgi:hypothetical protein
MIIFSSSGASFSSPIALLHDLRALVLSSLLELQRLAPRFTTTLAAWPDHPSFCCTIAGWAWKELPFFYLPALFITPYLFKSVADRRQVGWSRDTFFLPSASGK